MIVENFLQFIQSAELSQLPDIANRYGANPVKMTRSNKQMLKRYADLCRAYSSSSSKSSSSKSMSGLP